MSTKNLPCGVYDSNFNCRNYFIKEEGVQWKPKSSIINRLLQLINVPPQFVKFDARLIRGLTHFPQHQEIVVHSLIEMMHKISCQCIAEGVETQQDADLCVRLGFQFAQGFHFGRPATIDRILENLSS